MRVGMGFDVHRYIDGGGSGIVVGGVDIPFHRQILAHSDGDVLIHALCDALLGGAGMGDIGQHFPDSDSRYRNIDSRLLLRQVARWLGEAGLRPGNVDLTLIAQAPRFAPYIESMRRNLAEDLGMEPGRINIKATTTEGLGFAGREEGIAAQAVVLLE